MANNFIHLRAHFRQRADRSKIEALRRKQWFVKAQRDDIRRDKIADQAEETLLETVTAIVVAASAARIKSSQARIYQYDEATIKAFQENQIAMDEAKDLLAQIELHIQQMLGCAYVMDDGRRVFLTEDRTQAFDEFGVEVMPDELDFDLVSPDAPTWESYSSGLEAQTTARQGIEALEVERQAILDFQEKVDAAGERISDSDISEAELDDLDAELSEAMPPSIRKHVPGFDTTDNAADLQSEFSKPPQPAAEAKEALSMNAAPVSGVSK